MREDTEISDSLASWETFPSLRQSCITIYLLTGSSVEFLKAMKTLKMLQAKPAPVVSTPYRTLQDHRPTLIATSERKII